MKTQTIYVVEAYFRSPDGRFSFHPGETLNTDALVARGLLVPQAEGSSALVETDAMKTAIWRNALRRQEDVAAPEGPADVDALVRGTEAEAEPGDAAG